MASHQKRITFVFYTIVTTIIKLSYNDDANSVCDNEAFMSRNCEIQQRSQGLAMFCYRPFVDSRFSFKIISQLSIRCLHNIMTLTYDCQDKKRHSDLTNLTLEALPNLENLQLIDCKFDKLYLVNLAGTLKLRSLEIFNYPTTELNTNENEAGNCVNLSIEPLSINQLIDLERLFIFGMNMSMVPEKEFCNLNLTEVDFSNNALSDINSLSFGQSNLKGNQTCGQNLKHLSLASNLFHTLPSHGFSNLINLETLDLRDNKLSVINEDAFQNLKNLWSLHLDQNKIANITSRMWRDMTGLLELTITSNRIASSLVYLAFVNLPKISTIELNSNIINRIKSFSVLESVNSLHLSANVITTIDNGAFINASSLTYLELNQNKISIISSTTFAGLENMTSLHLSENKIAYISKTTFSKLDKLEYLDLSKNEIKHIDFSAFHFCPELFNLDLSSNRLNQAPDFSHSLEIRELDISGNEILSLPETCFANLIQLQSLNMARNNLSEIPKLLFENNSELRIIYLDNNFLTDIPENIFKHNNATEELKLNNNFLMAITGLKTLSNLSKLELQHNVISDLNFEQIPYNIITLNASYNNISKYNVSFSHLYETQLNTLDVSHNMLSTVPFEFFTLSHLNVSNNNLTYIKRESFQSMNDLEEVDLRYNKLVSLDLGATIATGNSKFLLEGNLLRCDCTTWWLKNVPIASSIYSYGLMQDLEQVNCTVRLLGSEGVQEMALVHVPVDRFLCEFKQDADKVEIYAETLYRHQHAQCVDECHCYFNHNWSVIVTYCSHRQLQSIPRDMPSMSLTIYLDGNNIRTLTKPSFDDYESATQLFINSSHVEIIEDNVFMKMAGLQLLHLENNRLKKLSEKTFAGLYSLMDLYLQSNVLHFLDPGVFLAPGSIRELRLDNNSLTVFPPFDLYSIKSLQNLTLENNQWDCQCTNDIVQKNYLLDQSSNQIFDRNHTRCFRASDTLDNPLLFTFYANMCDVTVVSFPLAYILVVVIVLVVVATVAILIFVYRHEMQVLIYSKYEFRIFRQLEDESTDDRNKMFDAFVAYSSLDEAFVVEELLPRLEGGERPFQLCLHHRDFKVGGFITNSILDAVECSRRTIVVMTENFANSNWCRFEFKSAHVKMMEDRCRRLIMIVLDEIPKDLDPEVQLYFKTNTYLQRSDRLFWEKLYFAMPKRKLQSSALELTQNENTSV